jgi:23S rRNA pseudouridine1911/1915/1917 synthase
MPSPPRADESPTEIEYVLPAEHAGLRLDVALAKGMPQFSRSFFTRLLKDGAVLINGKAAKPSREVFGGERVAIEVPAPEEIAAQPEDIPLDIIFEDQNIIVVNKPAGMVVHPSAGHTAGALVNALLFHCKDLSSINGLLRPGIVHRLDKDTSGVIVAAKNDLAHRTLSEQFAARTVKKEYVALCYGEPRSNQFSSSGRIVRHPVRRLEMTVARRSDEGREAHTEFEVLERFPQASALKTQDSNLKTPSCFLVRALPKTGRTHQIRVHLAKAGFPVLADGLYGRETAVSELGLQRHALHALRLTIHDPSSGKELTFEAPLAADIAGAVRKLCSQ